MPASTIDNWFQKLCAQYSATHERAQQYLSKKDLSSLSQPEVEKRLFAIYRAPEPFSNVFLGSADPIDKQIVRQVTGVQNIINHDVRNVPEQPSPGEFLWSNEALEQTRKEKFMPAVAELVGKIRMSRITTPPIPVYVHCEEGINRSPAVLASALAILGAGGITEMMQSMEEQRGIISPSDALWIMAERTFADFVSLNQSSSAEEKIEAKEGLPEKERSMDQETESVPIAEETLVRNGPEHRLQPV